MANLLARLFGYDANKPVNSLVPLDNEFNQLFGSNGALNGGSTDKKLLTRASDAADPPHDLDQLGAGPLARWKQNGIERARINNSGSFQSEASPPLVVSSPTLIPNLNADLVDGLHATSFVRKDDAATQTIISNLVINNANPGIVFDDTAGVDAKIDLDVDLLRFGSTIANQVTLNVSTGVASFAQIPVGPAADPTLPNQFTRKEYVDTRKTWWSMNWFLADPSTFPVNSFVLAQKVKVPNPVATNVVATGMVVMYNSGTASGSFTINIRKHPFNNQAAQTVLGTINTNPGAVGNEIFLDIADHTFGIGDYVYIILESISSPLQRDVSISLFGYQTPTS